MVAVPEVHCCSLGNVTAALKDNNRAGLTTHSFPTRAIVRKVQNSDASVNVMFLLFYDSFTPLSLLQFLSSSDSDFRLLCSPRVLVAVVLPSINGLTKTLLVYGQGTRKQIL